MAFIKELLDEAVSSCFVASTCLTHYQAQWLGFISDFCLIRRIHLGMKDSGNHLFNGSALAQKKLNSAGRRWIGECNAQATVIDLQERLFRRYLQTSKKSPILFTHQLDNWWVPASVQCWRLGERKTIVNNESIFCIILEPRNRMNLSSQSLPLWFGALELNNPLIAKNNGSGRWGPRKRLLRQSPVLATPGLPTWGDMWC